MFDPPRPPVVVMMAIGLLSSLVWLLANALVGLSVALALYWLYQIGTRARPILRKSATGEGVTGDVHIPFTTVTILATIRKES